MSDTALEITPELLQEWRNWTDRLFNLGVKLGRDAALDEAAARLREQAQKDDKGGQRYAYIITRECADLVESMKGTGR